MRALVNECNHEPVAKHVDKATDMDALSTYAD